MEDLEGTIELISEGMAAPPNRVIRREVTRIGDKSVEVEIEAEGEASHNDLADAVAALHRETRAEE